MAGEAAAAAAAAAVTQALQIGFADPKVSKGSGMTGMQMVAFFFSCKARVWLPGVEVGKKHAHRLVLQLAGAGILSVNVLEPAVDSKPSQKTSRRRVILRWAITRTPETSCMAFTEDARWMGITSIL